MECYRIVDVFSDRPLAGNALCVVIDGHCGMTTKGVLAVHQSGKANPLRHLENRNNRTSEPAAWLLSEQVGQVG